MRNGKKKPASENLSRAAVRDRLADASWERVVDDVQPFLEPRADLALLSYETMVQVLEQR